MIAMLRYVVLQKNPGVSLQFILIVVLRNGKSSSDGRHELLLMLSDTNKSLE